MENTPPANTTETDKVVPLRAVPVNTRSADAKWSKPVMQYGYTVLPSLLFEAQGKLKLSPQLFNVLLQLAMHWWKADEDPYPTKETIARRMGKSSRHMQRYMTQLEEKGFIRRIERFKGVKSQAANGYSLTGLVEALKKLEPEFHKVKEHNKIRRKRVETPVETPAAEVRKTEGRSAPTP